MEFVAILIFAVLENMRWHFKERARPKKIFVVEDSESDRALLRLNLKLRNCVIEYFDSCETIIEEIMINGRPDGVICDYFLAGRTKGDKLIEFCLNNKIEALLVTGHEGDILGVDNKRILRKSAEESYYKALTNWAEEVVA